MSANGALVAALRRGWARDPDVLRVLDAVPRAPFVAQDVRRHASVDAALPYLDFPPHATSVQPAPRTHALLLDLLELRRGQRVLVAGARSGWLPALVAQRVGAGRVTVLEYDAAERGWAEDALERAGFAHAATFRDDLPPAAEGPWDRIVATTPVVTLPPAYRDLLAEEGFLVAALLGETRHGLLKLVRSGDETVDLGLANVALGPPEFRGLADDAHAPEGPLGPHPRRGARPFTVGHLLSLETLAAHVWQDRVLTRDDATFREAVERTWDPPGKRRAEARRARAFFHLGTVHQAIGDLPTAIDLYGASLDLLPSSEAFTFRGWAHGIEGRLPDAMRDCEDAVAVDPTFGNPYNDMGAYLIELGRLDEAEGWLERAKRAPRYDALHFAYGNLGRLYMLRGEPEKARRELRQALDLAPHYAPAAEMLRRLDRGDE